MDPDKLSMLLITSMQSQGMPTPIELCGRSRVFESRHLSYSLGRNDASCSVPMHIDSQLKVFRTLVPQLLVPFAVDGFWRRTYHCAEVCRGAPVAERDTDLAGLAMG